MSNAHNGTEPTGPEPEIQEPEVQTLPAVAPDTSQKQVALETEESVLAYMKRLDWAIKECLKDGTDYGVIPGTGSKPTLMKPGAEKLCAAFALTAEFTLMDMVEDHENQFEYHDRYGNKKHGNGFFFYRYKCDLRNRQTGVVWGSSEGSFSNREPGKQTFTSNNVMKMAQKRAYVGATLFATFSSERFTQDMDDMDNVERPATGGGGRSTRGQRPQGANPHAPAPVDPNNPYAIQKEMKSKYGSIAKPTKCNHCGEYHVTEGDRIVLAATPNNPEAKWGSWVCYDKMLPGDDD